MSEEKPKPMFNDDWVARFIFVDEKGGEHCMPVNSDMIRNIRIRAIFEGMGMAIVPLKYDKKLEVLSDLFSLSHHRIRNIVKKTND